MYCNGINYYSIHDITKMTLISSKNLSQYIENNHIKPDYETIGGNKKYRYFVKESVDQICAGIGVTPDYTRLLIPPKNRVTAQSDDDVEYTEKFIVRLGKMFINPDDLSLYDECDEVTMTIEQAKELAEKTGGDIYCICYRRI